MIKPKSFFDEEKREWAKETREISREVRSALLPIIRKYATLGFSTREIENLIQDDVKIIVGQIRVEIGRIPEGNQ